MEQLAIFGGEKVVKNVPESLFKWPIITEEDEAAALESAARGDAEKGEKQSIDVIKGIESNRRGQKLIPPVVECTLREKQHDSGGKIGEEST